MPRLAHHSFALLLLVLSACHGCASGSSSGADAGAEAAADAGADAGVQVITQRVALPGGGTLEVRSGAATLVELRERPGIDAAAWRQVAAVAALTAALVGAHPLEEVGLSFEPMNAGATAEAGSGAAGVAALWVLEGKGPPEGAPPVVGLLHPDGLIVTSGEATALRSHAGGRPPQPLEPAALVLPQHLEEAFTDQASRWLEEATGGEAQLAARQRAAVTAAVDAASQTRGVERFERAGDAARLARAAADAPAFAEVVSRWQRIRATVEAQPVTSPLQAAQLLEAGRRLAAAWILLQGTPTQERAAGASVLLDEVDSWLTGLSRHSPSQVAAPERLVAIARVWLEAGRLSQAPEVRPLGLELAASILSGPRPTPAGALVALAASQDAYLSAVQGRLPPAPGSSQVVQASDLELRRSAGLARRAVGLPAGVAYDAASRRGGDPVGQRLRRWRATTTAQVILQLTPRPLTLH